MTTKTSSVLKELTIAAGYANHFLEEHVPDRMLVRFIRETRRRLLTEFGWASHRIGTFHRHETADGEHGEDSGEIAGVEGADLLDKLDLLPFVAAFGLTAQDLERDTTAPSRPLQQQHLEPETDIEAGAASGGSMTTARREQSPRDRTSRESDGGHDHDSHPHMRSRDLVTQVSYVLSERATDGFDPYVLTHGSYHDQGCRPCCDPHWKGTRSMELLVKQTGKPAVLPVPVGRFSLDVPIRIYISWLCKI